MKLHAYWGSYFPLLHRIVEKTTGDILEFGTGIFSTPYFHWIGLTYNRFICSYENDPYYYELLLRFKTDSHQLTLVDNWDLAKVDSHFWDIALIDHNPAGRRRVEIERLSKIVNYIIVHDTDMKNEKYYKLNTVYPLFKYKYYYTEFEPHTTVLSNFSDLVWLQ